MKKQTALATSIDVTDLNAQYDAACKRLLSNKEIPVNPRETNAAVPDITGMKNEDSVYLEGKVTYDIRFQAFYPGYPLVKRGIFYCSRMLSAQYGTEFTEPDYDKLKEVYSIWICLNPPIKSGNTIVQYHMTKTDLIGFTADRPADYDLSVCDPHMLGDGGAGIWNSNVHGHGKGGQCYGKF